MPPKNIMADQAATAAGKDWKAELDNFLLDYRTRVHATTGVTPASLMFGRKIANKLPEFVNEVSITEEDKKINARDSRRKKKMKESADRNRRTKEILL